MTQTIVVKPQRRVIRVTTTRQTTRVSISRQQIVVKNVGLRGPAGVRTIELTAYAEGPIEADRRISRYAPTGPVTLRPADAVARLQSPTVSQSIWPIRNEAGASLGDVTFGAGQTDGVVTLSQTALDSGDVLDVFTPSSVDPAENTFWMTLPGER